MSASNLPPQLAKVLSASLGANGGEVCGTVKRLGVDYKARFNQARKRFKVLAEFRKVCPLPRVYYAGVLPAALYGIELYEPDPRMMSSLVNGAVAASGIRPIGVTRRLAIVTASTTSHPWYKAVSGPILKYAREVWLSVCIPTASSRPDDCLSATELAKMWWEVSNTTKDTPRPH